jgi:hypothetical protein
MGLGVRILLERSEGEMPTITDYVSSGYKMVTDKQRDEMGLNQSQA